MEATITAVDTTVTIQDEDLLFDLEKLTDAELAQIGGGQGIFLL